MHRLSRRRRVRLVWLTLAALLLQQFALVVHACERFEPAPTADALGHCATQDAPAPHDEDLLCAKHCAPDRAAPSDAGVAKLPAVPPAPALPVVALQPLLSVHDVGNERVASGPPPTLRFCSLLI